MRNKVYLLIAFICLSANYIKAQDYIGKYGNNVGSQGMFLNPSSITTSNLYADFGLAFGASLQNDYFHITSRDVLRMISDTTVKIKYPKTVSGLPRLFDYNFDYGKDGSTSANVGVDAVVLSGMYNVNGKHAFAGYLRFRTNVSAYNVPNEILELSSLGYSYSYKVGDGLLGMDTTVYYNQYARSYENKNVNLGVMSWSELGCAYSTTLHKSGYGRLDFGGTLKLAFGHAATALSLDEFDYKLKLGKDGNINDSLWYMEDLRGSLAYSLPVWYDKPFSTDGKMTKNLFGNYVSGFGAGIDVGITYTHKRNSNPDRIVSRSCEEKKIDYLWRAGLSIIDFGAVYYGGNAEVTKVKTTEGILNTKDFYGVNTVHDFVNVFNKSFDSKTEKKSFLMGLPTAVSVQFDYNIIKHLYVNAVLVQPVRFLKYHVTRDAQLFVAPRFESRLIDFSLPVTLVNYERVYLGAALRVAFLTIGTQNLLNLVGVGEVYGLDFYISLKFNFFKGRCGTVYDGCWNSDFGSKKSRR